jgi:hypothetical protein
MAARRHILAHCLCDGVCKIAGFSALEMHRQNQIGFWGRFCGLLEE